MRFELLLMQAHPKSLRFDPTAMCHSLRLGMPTRGQRFVLLLKLPWQEGLLPQEDARLRLSHETE